MHIQYIDNKLFLKFEEELTLHNITSLQKKIDSIDFSKEKYIVIDFTKANFLDTAAAIYIYNLEKNLTLQKITVEILCNKKKILDILELVKVQKEKSTYLLRHNRRNFIEKIGEHAYRNYKVLTSFMAFLGELFAHKMYYFTSFKNIRYKEIAFEINESAVKAFSIVALTSFLIGVVIAYQSAHQLKIYGANIFIVDMLGISILRELSPLITAIVIAGRSGSAFTAQIGAMKITQELDAMRTMGFDPFKFLVLPKIIALMITMPILIFISDITAIIGGMLVANINLGITTDLFIDRFNEVIAIKDRKSVV